eukprot:CAMPEP_0171931652 /NCGR_PEP_ID=MMETSP0993-20121228/29634_1 /TAXON_ID=483369 /ORGANISM="non described non described, Strain CCMP2098" /LENGTH=53 /DNA_ID=CAMNT_0012571723 /DNA_START=87 /DNA_END=245 /DNA_ORIENTATION=+
MAQQGPISGGNNSSSGYWHGNTEDATSRKDEVFQAAQLELHDEDAETELAKAP